MNYKLPRIVARRGDGKSLTHAAENIEMILMQADKDKVCRDRLIDLFERKHKVHITIICDDEFHFLVKMRDIGTDCWSASHFDRRTDYIMPPFIVILYDLHKKLMEEVQLRERDFKRSHSVV